MVRGLGGWREVFSSVLLLRVGIVGDPELSIPTPTDSMIRILLRSFQIIVYIVTDLFKSRLGGTCTEPEQKDACARRQLRLKIERTSEEFGRKAFGLEFVWRATGMFSGLRKVINWTVWRDRHPPERETKIGRCAGGRPSPKRRVKGVENVGAPTILPRRLKKKNKKKLGMEVRTWRDSNRIKELLGTSNLKEGSVVAVRE
jgi:hypothetical protein